MRQFSKGASTLNYYVGIFGGGVARPMEGTAQGGVCGGVKRL
jgi:hypothetical protein